MTEYFSLQFKRLGRMCREWGVHPILPLLLIVILSVLGWKACSTEPKVAYGLGVAVLLLPIYLESRARNEFLKSNFSKFNYLNIRIIEALLIVSLPLLILLLNQKFLIAGVAILCLVISRLLPIRRSSSFVSPSPFSRWPFEFTRGFRKTWLLYAIGVFLLIMAIQVDNPNLGLFALAIPFFLSLSYYLEPEDPYFVWIHRKNPQAFLVSKMKIALVYSLSIALPMAIAYGLFFPENVWPLALLQIAGLVWVMTSLLAKYAHFPSELNLLQGFALIFTIAFPPLAFLVIPVLYMKAKKNLEHYLP